MIKVILLKEKSFEFAKLLLSLYYNIQPESMDIDTHKQLIRAGVSIGALCREAELAESEAEFSDKMAIAQRKCSETIYWLELLKATDRLDELIFLSIHENAVELLKQITRARKTRNKP